MGSTPPQDVLQQQKQAILRALWRDKMHVERQALTLSPPAVRARYEHIWEPATLLLEELRLFPLGMLRLWWDGPAGHLVFTHRASHYVPGIQLWQEQRLEGVCYLSLGELASERERAMGALFALWDHLLGSGALAEQGYFSAGKGLTPTLHKLAQRFVHIHRLGYGHEATGAKNSQEYFCRTLWLYLRAPRQLNTIDPLVFKLYRHGLMQEHIYR